MTLPVTTELLQPLLSRAVDSVPHAVGAGIGVFDGSAVSLLAGAGCAERFDELQNRLGEGPTPAAATAYQVVVSDDLNTDERWPRLKSAVRTSERTDAEPLATVARPGPWNAHGVTVFSFYLTRPPEQDVLAEIAQHEAPAAIALGLIECKDSQRVDQMRELVRSRGVIDQAKGIIMGHIRCSPDEAFNVLRLASQQYNVKVRELAAAFVRHVTTAQRHSGQGHGGPQPEPATVDKVAELVWQSLRRR